MIYISNMSTQASEQLDVVEGVVGREGLGDSAVDKVGVRLVRK
jgi:hypothetical protein